MHPRMGGLSKQLRPAQRNSKQQKSRHNWPWAQLAVDVAYATLDGVGQKKTINPSCSVLPPSTGAILVLARFVPTCAVASGRKRPAAPMVVEHTMPVRSASNFRLLRHGQEEGATLEVRPIGTAFNVEEEVDDIRVHERTDRAARGVPKVVRWVPQSVQKLRRHMHQSAGVRPTFRHRLIHRAVQHRREGYVCGRLPNHGQHNICDHHVRDAVWQTLTEDAGFPLPK
mmetsp:Transcript_105856/g.306177  ORF Transcript_105856/g.306177 Transcript_105856/m.306177 type:complete len:227 (+) Transcript_105856:49-729(+)